jgi:NAD(P)-dependent dehydrogenase (short-subunit alcohol dehydrogenase family)
VRVNAVAPGVVDTDMVRVLRDAAPPRGPEAAAEALQAQLDGLRELHLLGRIGTPEDVAEAVMYLVGAQFVTGTVLVCDGGLLLS